MCYKITINCSQTMHSAEMFERLLLIIARVLISRFETDLELDVLQFETNFLNENFKVSESNHRI